MMLARVVTFAEELRRRHVIRVAVGYCAGGWVIAQGSATLLPALGVPPWSVTLVTVLLLLGLPVALALAWAFDITAAGVIRTPEGSARTRGGVPAARRGPGAEGVMLRPHGMRTAHAAAADAAVLVMPFSARTAAGDTQHLAAGTTEELISTLAQEGARVLSRTTADALQRTADPHRGAAEFGVTHIVEGSVGSADDRLRVTVRLVDAVDGVTLWSNTYDRGLHDVLLVQRAIATSVVAALRPALLPQPGGAAAPDPNRMSAAPDYEAYVHYLRGRQQWEERTPEALRRALDSFTRAAARDATYARAHAGVADCWAILVDHGTIAPAEGLPLARAAAERALRLAPELPEALTSAALLDQLEWRWSAAERGFRAALAVNPGYQVARQRLALLLAWLGRSDEARAEMNRAIAADPLSPVIATSRAWLEYFARCYDDAVDFARTAVREHDSAHARIPLALALTCSGRPAAAVEELLPYAHDNSATPALLGALALALGRAGRMAEARQAAQRVHSCAAGVHVQPCTLAHACLGSGDTDAALDMLERAEASRAPQLIYCLNDPAFDGLRTLPRFRRITVALAAG